MKLRSTSRRRGTFLPMLAICLVGMLGMLALAIDLGMMTVSRADCQDAADAQALMGTRMLNTQASSVNNNAQNAVLQSWTVNNQNYLLNSQLTNANVTTQVGVYSYNTTSLQFSAGSWSTTMAGGSGGNPGAPPTGTPWTAIKSTVTGNQPTFFSKIFGVTSTTTGATAVAVHRPRDTAMVLDFTGSMGYGTIPQMGISLNEPNSVYPQFANFERYKSYNNNYWTAFTGSYPTSGAPSTRPNLFQNIKEVTSAPYVETPMNLTMTTKNGPPMMRDFWRDPSNDLTPSTPVATTTNGSLRMAFHWSPTEVAGNPLLYVGQTYDFTNYKTDGTGVNGNVNTPAPDGWAAQADTTTNPAVSNCLIPYKGDLAPRKYGYIPTNTSVTINAAGTVTQSNVWDPTDPNGAAVTLAEYLGWVPKYTSSTGSTLNTTFPAAAVGTGRSWNNFRDATWERYGYDLDVADYVANRNSGGATWDPRWDWNISTGTWMHVGASFSPPATTWRPKLKTSGLFQGYSMGPGYWGKTFLQWPPDPRWPTAANPNAPSNDWRMKFFSNAGLTQQNANSTLLTNGNGPMLKSSNTINYNAVLSWIVSNVRVFPGNLRSGRVLYYSSIPTSTSGLDGTYWQQYINCVLNTSSSVKASGNSGTYLVNSEQCGWPETSTGTKVTPSVSSTVPTAWTLPNIPAGINTLNTPDPAPYMNYTDNPARPTLEGWFGPMSMVAYLNHNNFWSGSTHQSQCWQLKAGVSSTLDDVKNNHPNDFMGLAFFCSGSYSTLMVPIGQDFVSMKNALYFPRNLLKGMVNSDGTANTTNTTEWRPYGSGGPDAGVSIGGNIPNAQNSTDPNSGFMYAYNILTSSPNGNVDNVNWTTFNSARSGRRGATKIVVFETDGAPNCDQGYTYHAQGYNSYYQPNGSWGNYSIPSSTSAVASAYQCSDAINIVKQIVANANLTTTSGSSGFSLPNSPARVFSIGFGDAFSTSSAAVCSQFLLLVQQAGNTSAASDTAIPSYQIITGDYNTRISNLTTALQRIFQSGVQVTLIQ